MSSKNQTKESDSVKDSTTSLAMQQGTDNTETSNSQSNTTPSSTSEQDTKVNSDMAQSQNGNIEQVREILFGTQMRAQEDLMLSKVEELNQMQEESRDREANYIKEINRLKNRIENYERNF